MSDYETNELTPVLETEHRKTYESKPPLPGVLENSGLTVEKWQTLEKNVFDYLVDNEFIDIDEEGEISADLERISNFGYRHFKTTLPTSSSGGVTYSDRVTVMPTSSAIFANIFHDREVAVKGGDPEDKRPLVYIPEDSDSAFDRQPMKKSWMGLHEIGRNAGYGSIYPTKKEGFESELTDLDIAVPYMIYALGNGERDENGVLYVDKKIDDPESGRQPISGLWFRNNGFKGPQDARMDYRPQALIEKYGEKWEEDKLLLESDFSEANWAKKDRDITNAGGRVTIDGNIYYLGSNYAGGKIEPITASQYVVYDKQGNIAALFDKEIDEDNLSETTAVSREVRGNTYTNLTVNKAAVNITPINQLGSYTNMSYEGNQRKRTQVDVYRELPSLVGLRESLDSQSREELSKLTLEEQINTNRVIRALGEQGDMRGREFIEKTGGAGMKLFSDAESFGRPDSRILDIIDLPEDQREKLMQDYLGLRSSTEKLTVVLKQKAKEKNVDLKTLVLIDRLGQALKSRSADFLLVDAKSSVDQQSTRMESLAEATGVLASVINNEIEFTLTPMEDSKTNAQMGRYELEDGSVFDVVVRPQATENAQARVSFVYRNKDGKRTDLRLDHDKYGLSLDIARRNTDLHDELNDLGKSHHTQAVFEKGLSMSPDEFKQLASHIPTILEWS